MSHNFIYPSRELCSKMALGEVGVEHHGRDMPTSPRAILLHSSLLGYIKFCYTLYSQKSGEEFAKFYGLLRIYELYLIINFLSIRLLDLQDLNFRLRAYSNENTVFCSYFNQSM